MKRCRSTPVFCDSRPNTTAKFRRRTAYPAGRCARRKFDGERPAGRNANCYRIGLPGGGAVARSLPVEDAYSRRGLSTMATGALSPVGEPGNCHGGTWVFLAVLCVSATFLLSSAPPLSRSETGGLINEIG